MQSQVSEISPVLVEVSVEVPWETVKEDLDKTYRTVGRQARVKGFRPGKVPLGVVRKMFGKQVRAEVVGGLMEQGLRSAVVEHEIMMVAEPDVSETPDITDGESLKFKAQIEVRPKIDAVDYKGLVAWKDDTPVPDEDIDAEIERRREHHAEIQEPEPMRPSKDGDTLTVDFKVTVAGEEKPEMAAEDRPIVLGSEGLLDEFNEGLAGKQPGDEVEVKVTFPEDHTNDELKGQEAVFAITIKELREKLLPEVDDEFAVDCDFENLADMKAKIRTELEEAADRRRTNDLRDQLIEALIEKNEIPVPPSMVKQQQQMMMYELAQFMQLAGGGMPPDFFEGIEGRAEKRVRAGLLLSALARVENVEVSDEDFDAKLNEIAEKTGKHVAKVKADYQGERRDELQNELLNDKLLAMLEEAAEIKAGKKPEPEKTDESDESEESNG